jgi:trigger factor
MRRTSVTAEATNIETGVQCEVEELDRWRRRLEIQVSAARVERVRRRTVRRFARRARLKGFRQGKAPDRLVEKQYGPEIDQEVLEGLVREGVTSGIEQSGLNPIVTPRIENVHWTPEGNLEFAAEFDIRPEIELGRATGFRVAKRAAAISESDVDRVLDRLRRDRAEWRSVDRPAGDGDRIGFNSVPLDDEGRPREAERIENHRVELGVDSLLPDFEAGLIGLAPGAMETITVRFPDDHPNEPLRGMIRVFRVEVEGVEERVLPELDDAFAASLGAFGSLAAARDHIGKNLGEELAQQSEREVNEALIDEIIAANRIDLPESMVDRYLGSMLSDHEGPLQGRVPSEKQAEVRELLRPGAERAIRRHYILNYLADREGLRPSEEELDAAIAERIDTEHSSAAEMRTRLERSGQIEDLRFHLTMERVFAWLREHSIIETSDAES